MSIQKTTTDLSALKINELTQDMYDNALKNGEINSNELYVTPFDCGYVVENNWTELFNETVSFETFSEDSNGTMIDSPLLDSDQIKVMFNNTEYVCDNNPRTAGTEVINTYGASIITIEDSMVMDYSIYPFQISSSTYGTEMRVPLSINSATVQIYKENLNVTTTSEFNAAVAHVLETNLQSAEGGSY